jgi:RNA polymerase sigma factor (sigma-70 family)
MAKKVELPPPPEPGNMWNCSALLNREQEQLLFRKYNYLKYRTVLAVVGNNWRSVMEDPAAMEAKISRMSSDRVKLAERFISESEEVRNTIVRSNVRLVVRPVSRQESGDTVRREELISDACAHVMKAVERFDYRRGFRFSTYCVNVIQNNLRRDFLTERNRLRKFGGEEDEKNPSVYWDTPDTRKYAHEFVHGAIATLEPRQRRVLEGLFGIDRERVFLQDVAAELGISRNTVVKIRDKALAALSEIPCDFPER